MKVGYSKVENKEKKIYPSSSGIYHPPPPRFTKVFRVIAKKKKKKTHYVLLFRRKRIEIDRLHSHVNPFPDVLFFFIVP